MLNKISSKELQIAIVDLGVNLSIDFNENNLTKQIIYDIKETLSKSIVDSRL